jgi:hypothetical protein
VTARALEPNLWQELQPEPVLGQRVRFTLQHSHGIYPDAIGIGVCNPYEFTTATEDDILDVTLLAWEQPPTNNCQGYLGFPIEDFHGVFPLCRWELEAIP